MSKEAGDGVDSSKEENALAIEKTGITPITPTKPAVPFWRRSLGIAVLVLAVGYTVIMPVAEFLISLLRGGSQSYDVTTGVILFSMIANTLIMVGCPLAFLWLGRGLPPFSGFRELGFGIDKKTVGNAGFGLLAGTGFLFSIYIIFALAVSLGYVLPKNPLADSLVESLSLPLALIISILAAFSEETFFRGFLQPRIGIAGSSILFGIAHISYGTYLQVAIPFLLGLAMAFLYKRTGSIYAPVAAHFAFNFVQMALALYAGDLVA